MSDNSAQILSPDMEIFTSTIDDFTLAAELVLADAEPEAAEGPQQQVLLR